MHATGSGVKTIPLSRDHADKLSLQAQIIGDRGVGMNNALEDSLDVDGLDHIAMVAVDVLEAAQAIEILCARLVRWKRQDARADEADRIDLSTLSSRRESWEPRGFTSWPSSAPARHRSAAQQA